VSVVKVTRKGQITIPQELRTKIGIEEGDFVQVTEEGGVISVKLLPPPTPGEVVGQEAYQKILGELEEARRRWR